MPSGMDGEAAVEQIFEFMHFWMMMMMTASVSSLLTHLALSQLEDFHNKSSLARKIKFTNRLI